MSDRLKQVSVFLKKTFGIYRTERVSACPVCGSAQKAHYRRIRKGLLFYVLERCRGCGLIYQNPRLTPRSLAQFYNNEYRWRGRGRESAYANKVFSRGVRRGERILQFLAGHGISATGKRVFEYGCGYGGIVFSFNRAGSKTSGADLDSDAVAYARARGLDVICSDTPSFAGEETNNVIVISHLLEHMSDPVVFLRSVKRGLQAGGYLFVAVPILDSEDADLYRNVQEGHLLYFTRDSLLTTLRSAGFAEVAMDGMGYGIFTPA